MKDLPRRPGPTSGLFEVIDYLADIAEFLGDSAMSLDFRMGQIVATQAELQAKIDRLTASVAQIIPAINHQIEQLRAAVDQLSLSQPPTQNQLNLIEAAASALEQAGALLMADDESAPAPTSTPEPTPTP